MLAPSCLCQVSDNAHKKFVEPSPKDARTCIYYRNVIARQTAESALTEVMRETTPHLQIDDPTIHYISDHEPHSFGLDIPEPVVRQAYIMLPDLTPIIGWETGRASEPAFMDMNLHSVRGNSSPNVVLYQFDLSDPMNPHGLLIAYDERDVKPVCSDFDTFTVGSKGFDYEPVSEKQLELVNWALDHTTELLKRPSAKGWMSRWLDVLKAEAAKGFHPELPKFGFGDPTSYELIGMVVDATDTCGAVRHGAECFNFYFPQDLDDQFLIVWDGYADPPWRSVTEPELRAFLLERCADGYCFPINPVWPIRDVGWHEVLCALKKNADGAKNLKSWFPPNSGVLERIEKLHGEYPNGFAPLPQPPDAAGAARPAMLTKDATRMRSMMGSALLAINLLDLECREMADYSMAEVRGEVKMRWRRARNAFIAEARIRKRIGLKSPSGSPSKPRRLPPIESE